MDVRYRVLCSYTSQGNRRNLLISSNLTKRLHRRRRSYSLSNGKQQLTFDISPRIYLVSVIPVSIADWFLFVIFQPIRVRQGNNLKNLACPVRRISDLLSSLAQTCFCASFMNCMSNNNDRI